MLSTAVLSGLLSFRIASNLEKKRHSLEQVKITECLAELQVLMAEDTERADTVVKVFNDTFKSSTYREALERFHDRLRKEILKTSSNDPGLKRTEVSIRSEQDG